MGTQLGEELARVHGCGLRASDCGKLSSAKETGKALVSSQAAMIAPPHRPEKKQNPDWGLECRSSPVQTSLRASLANSLRGENPLPLLENQLSQRSQENGGGKETVPGLCHQFIAGFLV